MSRLWSKKRKRLLKFFLMLIFCASGIPDAPCDTIKSAKSLTLERAADYKYMTPSVVRTVSLPKSYHEGLFYDNGFMWVANGKGGNVWKIDLASGSIISELDSFGKFTESMVRSDTGSYYLSDWDEKKVYRIAIDGSRIIEEASLSIAPAHPAGLAWAKNALLVLTWTRGVFGTKFEILELDSSLAIMRRIGVGAIQEACQMAWDGSHLWISSWFDGKVYKVDIDRWIIMGHFSSPVELTTGLAFDGASLWITGTNSDLYRMEHS